MMHFTKALVGAGLCSTLVHAAAISLNPVKRAIPGYQTQCTSNAAITFDDGPYIYSQRLVNELLSYGAQATFFVNGYNYGCIYSEANVASLRHAYESGMAIGSHTWNHYDITLSGTSTLGHQLDLLESALWKILGVKPALFRPPYGAINDELLAYLNTRGYTVIGWSDDSGDSGGASVEESEEVVDEMEEGGLVLMHETYPGTVEGVVPNSVPGLVARGVKLVTVADCLGVAPYQAFRGSYGIRDETWTCEGTPIPGQGF